MAMIEQGRRNWDTTNKRDDESHQGDVFGDVVWQEGLLIDSPHSDSVLLKWGTQYLNP